MLTPDLLRRALALPIDSPFSRVALAHEGALPAAVAVPVRLEPGPASAFLVLRSQSLREYAGQVGFPGGKPDPADRDLTATALREMEEEIGIGAGEVEVLGPLGPQLVISARYRIHPFGALLPAGARPRVASPEIERVLEVPLLPWIEGAREIHAGFAGAR